MTGRIKARRFCGQTLFSPSCTGLLQSNNWHPLLETKAKPAPSSANISTPHGAYESAVPRILTNIYLS